MLSEGGILAFAKEHSRCDLSMSVAEAGNSREAESKLRVSSAGFCERMPKNGTKQEEKEKKPGNSQNGEHRTRKNKN